MNNLFLLIGALAVCYGLLRLYTFWKKNKESESESEWEFNSDYSDEWNQKVNTFQLQQNE